MNKIKMWWAVNHDKVIIQKMLYTKKYEGDFVIIKVALALNGIHFGYETRASFDWDTNVFRLLAKVVHNKEMLREQEHEYID